MKPRGIFILTSLIVLATISVTFIFWKPIAWSLILFGPLIILGYIDIFQKTHAIRRNFPVIGNIRYLLEKIRPEIMQYFVETDTEGRPIDRINRSLIYERAKRVNDTEPFGTQMDIYEPGYEWIEHSIYAGHFPNMETPPRILFGGKDCTQPYSASILNISAMSFGSLSENAVRAMNKGAAMGGFAHNTGEGGISPHHLEHGGDLIWQVGTGYFGCRDANGKFDAENYRENATRPSVKMIELKLSQGAKPGHGGILPAIKNTPEIAKIRGIKPFETVYSPPSHSAFSSASGLLEFIASLRELSGGKPTGFKLCVGKRKEFIDICQAMRDTGIKPDFITVDGGEGGTGAAPVEFSNSVGAPMMDGLVFVHDALTGFGLREEIRIISSGKIFSSFHIARAIALGADTCNSARAMMLATGCIQSLQCHLNTCPVGVATQDKRLMHGLNVPDKATRVANYHKLTIHSFQEVLSAANITQSHQLKREHINRRVSDAKVLTFGQIYPDLSPGCMLKKETIPEIYAPLFN